MRERPILFSAPMVRAILDGRKTQTRRVIKLQTGDTFDEKALKGAIQEWRPVFDKVADRNASKKAVVINCPYGQPGDRLWVKENLKFDIDSNDWFYRADGAKCIDVVGSEPETPRPDRWPHLVCNSIHLARHLSRITLEVTGVRVERLHEISAADAACEGVFGEAVTDAFRDVHAVDMFRCLWSGINGTESWDANPWVWVVEFKRVEAQAVAA